MFGIGVLKGLGVTLKEFINTYIDDVKRIPSRYAGGREEIDQSRASANIGLFTIQYPEERRKLQERFRYIPMLLYEAETGEDRCTACGICAKVCPPQCIWIVRAKDEKGKPVPKPAEFYIDTTICMNCGLCAEFCPFDAIKMNHDYEIAAYHRMPSLIFDLQQLRVPTTYYARLRPTDWAEEEAARKAKEAEKAAKPAAAQKPETGGQKLETGSQKLEAGAPSATPPPSAPATEAAPTGIGARRTPEEIERLKAEAAARRAAKAGGEAEGQKPEAGAPSETPPPSAPVTGAAPTGVGARRTPEEIERLKAEAAARRAAKAAGEVGSPGPEAGSQKPETGSQKLEAGSQKLEAGAPSATPEPSVLATGAAPTGVGARRTPEEIERLKAEAAARRAAKAAQSGGEPR